ncbi:mCG140201, partial [Mus musculus]
RLALNCVSPGLPQTCGPSVPWVAGGTDSLTQAGQHTFSRMWEFQLASSGPRKLRFQNQGEVGVGTRLLRGRQGQGHTRPQLHPQQPFNTLGVLHQLLPGGLRTG